MRDAIYHAFYLEITNVPKFLANVPKTFEGVSNILHCSKDISGSVFRNDPWRCKGNILYKWFEDGIGLHKQKANMVPLYESCREEEGGTQECNLGEILYEI